MLHKIHPIILLLRFGACVVLSAVAARGAVDFEKDVRPILAERCVECHGEKKQKADLRLDAKHFAFKGGENGAVIVAGDGAKSPLFQRIVTEDEDERMPPKGDVLTKEQVGAIKAWINEGAVWPESDADKVATKDKRLEHWAFLPVRKADAERNRIDDFVVAKLKENGLKLSKVAERRTLIRRVYFDVIGLPPTPEEVEAFVSDKDPKAYEKLVDRLLASPRFGERWARHWLDVVRFAESDGFETNRERKNAWPYRDYVIRAFNEDKPFDQFVREQIAGDSLGEDAATGFLVGGPIDRVKSPDPVLTANQRADELHDIVSTTGASFIGLTINCARCHDHKFDPILMKDYYAMTALLQGVRHGERALRSADTDENQKKAAELRKQVAPLDAKLVKFQPRARAGRVVLVDDASEPSTASRAGVTQVEQPKNGMPVEYSPGRERGQADDPGDVLRLPNLGASYRYWDTAAAEWNDVFTWDPRVTGNFRIWISWAVWTTHTQDALYVLDRDGNLATTNDQSVIARVDQSHFPDGESVAQGQKRWSGFKLAGTHALSSQSVVVLRTGAKGGPHTADVLAFEEVVEGGVEGSQPALRTPVQHSVNEERFADVTARYLRFTVTACSTIEPCLDELEVFDAKGVNIALAKNGTTATASGTYANNPKHRLEHINDGKYGNDLSWISNTRGAGWVQLEFAKPQMFGRVTWSRDRKAGKAYEDRLATGYRIEVSADGTNWQFVASSSDRLADAYRTRVTTIPTLAGVAGDEAKTAGVLLRERSELQNKIAELSKSQMGYVGTFQQPGPTFRNHRGDPMQPKEAVLPATLSLIGKKIELAESAQEQERRQALAKWIVDSENPLTARVIVNRLWHYHFGAGIVETPSDFGINGGRRSHPELLDWLASELVANGWRLKHVHRLILLSDTYRQDSAMNEKAFAKDSSARLLWRYPPRRIEAEVLRDTMLAVSGKLDPKMGGPGFDLFEPNENYVKVYKTKTDYGPAEFRRMVYQSKPRTMLDDFFGAFDCPDAGQPAPKRTASTTPLQALNLLNSNFAIQQAGHFSERLKAEAGDDTDAQIKRAFQLAFGRAPTRTETSSSHDLIAKHGLPILCRALFNANEFVRVE